MSVSYDFSGQVALVTGASSGIGRAAALAFADAGAAVGLLGPHVSELEELARLIEDRGAKAAVFACDVTDEAQVAAGVDGTVKAFGGLDMAYNNAGIQHAVVEVADQDAEDYDRVLAINLRGIWAATKHELIHMRKHGSGAIVNCSSVGGIVGGATRAAYHASKHGVIGLTRSAALENAARGIRVNAVCPGTIDTPMVADMMQNQPDTMKELMKLQAIGRLGKPEEIAAAVMWLCSPAASFVIGEALVVDGGFTIN